ncbi:MAG: rhodanese-like domain-containing protein [Opitutus sp.]|nr:rhodanese-like domain-containing protein [Opitutus sp.]
MNTPRPLFWLSGLCSTVSAVVAAEVPRVAPEEAARRVAAGEAILIDVREPDEWAETGVAAPAELLPMSDFNGEGVQWAPFLKAHEGKPLILYCRSGNRSGKVAAALKAKGIDASNGGSLAEWQAAGLPVRKP